MSVQNKRAGLILPPWEIVDGKLNGPPTVYKCHNTQIRWRRGAFNLPSAT
jgi:hypothetical protein